MRTFRPTLLALALADLAALLTACMLAYTLRTMWPAHIVPSVYMRILPLLFFFIPLYAVLSLYPGIIIPRPEFLKRATTATSLGFLFIGALLLVSQRAEVYSRVILVGSWCIALFSVPLFRYFAEKLFSRFSWWGYPAIIFGHPNVIKHYYKHLLHNKQKGFNPVAACTLAETPGKNWFEFVTLATSPKEIKKQMRELKKQRSDVIAIVAMDKMSAAQQQKLFSAVTDNFSKILLLPESAFNMRLSVRVASFCGQLALSLRQNLLDPYRVRMKRAVDLLLAVMLLPVLLPLILCIYVIVRLDSPGSGFYRHTRLGYGGREIRIWKFRTMYKNSGEMLRKILEEKPEMREEWERDQKLKNDPRITRAGRFLRKFSLDELPQIINVFWGNMSLVGPRPIIAQEIPRYGASYSTYIKVKPGVTGLWQVSGRNNVSYAARVALDEYYIANWSVWLDIYILVRTAPAALRSEGAY